MAKQTRHIGLVVTVAAPATLILERNPNRIEYSIQNQDAANFVCLGTDSNVTCEAVGAETNNTGARVVAGQNVSDDLDQGRVYARANTGDVHVSIIEVSNPRETGERARRRGTRGFG